VFDRDGQHLYFTASTNFGQTSSGLDMTSDEHEVTSNVYLAVLPNNVASPLVPESDEEKPAGEAQADSGGRGGRGGRGGQGGAVAEPPKPVRIDFDKLEQRILALPVPARNYTALATDRAASLYLMEAGAGGRGGGQHAE
jgi:tricorn protease